MKAHSTLGFFKTEGSWSTVSGICGPPDEATFRSDFARNSDIMRFSPSRP